MPSYLVELNGKQLTVSEEDFQKLKKQYGSPQGDVGMTRGPIGELPTGGSVGMKDVASTSELPFMFRLKLQFARQNPQDLAKVLNDKGFTLEPMVEGRMIARSPEGKRFALDEFMPGPAAIQYGPKIAAYGALAAGPEAGIPAFLGRSALGSLAGSAQEITSRKALGLSAGTSPGQVGQETGMNMLLDMLTRGVGGGIRTLTGAGRARSAYDATIGPALAENAAKISEITQATQKAQAAANQFQFRAIEREAAKIGKENVRQEFANAMGVSLSDLEKGKTEALPGLSARTGSIKTTLTGAARKVMDRISKEYDTVLAPYNELPVETANYRGATSTVRSWLAERVHEPSSAFEGLLDDVETLGGKAAGGRLDVKTTQGKPLTFTAGATSMEERSKLMGLLQGRETTVSKGAANVEQARAVVSKLQAFATSAKSPMEARAATQLADAVQESVGAVLPEEVQGTVNGLNSQWYEANKLVGRKFRATVRESSNPAQVADALLGSSGTARSLGVERAHTLLGEVSDEELPVVRSAVLERILRAPSPDKYASTIDETLMKRLFKGTAIQDPKRLTQAINNAYKAEWLVRDPKYMDRLGQAAEKSFQSVVGTKKAEALHAAEAAAMRDISELVSPEEQAREAARKAAQKTPGFLRWLGHHAAYRGGLFLLGAGYATHSEPLYAAAPFLLGRAALEHYLGDPKYSKMYLDMVLSPSAEKKGFLLGRLAASMLSEYGKSMTRTLSVQSQFDRPNTLAAPTE